MLSLLRTILSAQVFAAQAARLRDEARYTVACAITLLIVALLMIVAAGFFTAAIYISLARIYGPVTASLSIGGGYLLIALITLCISAISSRRRSVSQQPLRASGVNLEGDLAAAAQSAVQGLTEAVREINPEELAHKGGQALVRNVGPLPLAGIAVIAGYLLARRLDR